MLPVPDRTARRGAGDVASRVRLLDGRRRSTPPTMLGRVNDGRRARAQVTAGPPLAPGQAMAAAAASDRMPGPEVVYQRAGAFI